MNKIGNSSELLRKNGKEILDELMRSIVDNVAILRTNSEEAKKLWETFIRESLENIKDIEIYNLKKISLAFKDHSLSEERVFVALLRTKLMTVTAECWHELGDAYMAIEDFSKAIPAFEEGFEKYMYSISHSTRGIPYYLYKNTAELKLTQAQAYFRNNDLYEALIAAQISKDCFRKEYAGPPSASEEVVLLADIARVENVMQIIMQKLLK